MPFRATAAYLTLAIAPLALACRAPTDSAPLDASQRPPAYDPATLFKGLVLANGPAADYLAARRSTPRLSDFARDPDQLRRISAFQDRLIVAIDEAEPEFLSAFAEAMTSGRHTAIQAMLNRTGDVVLKAVLTLGEAQDLRTAMADRAAVQAAVAKRMAALDRTDPFDQAVVREVVEGVYASATSESRAEDHLPPVFPLMQNPDGRGGGGGGGCVYVYVAAVYVAVAVDAALVSNYVVAIAIATTLAVGSAPAPVTQLARERWVDAIASSLAG